MEKPLTLSERKRVDIINAAQDEFKEKGYLGASMDALAKRAEVSKRTVYNHFPSKEELFQAIVKQLCDSFTLAATVTYQAHVPLADQLMGVARAQLALFESQKFRDLNRIALGEFIRSPELAARTVENMSQQEGGLDTWVTSAIDDGRLKSVDAEYAAHQFIGLIKSTALWPQLLMRKAFPNTEQQEQIAQDAVFMFLARYEVVTT